MSLSSGLFITVFTSALVGLSTMVASREFSYAGDDGKKLSIDSCGCHEFVRHASSMASL